MSWAFLSLLLIAIHAALLCMVRKKSRGVDFQAGVVTGRKVNANEHIITFFNKDALLFKMFKHYIRPLNN
jgi:hypothetical protein